ncbi:hypothetical protein F511_08290 [Dorcoceras hygrometricum]|uniref:Uncharacterized protein n=1 Tax=Dorcoceras hygrometricum TaxID=472368 RepID=A0A2Z7AI86_9LAMI|nr:hypothetical protein F511_08290 [Dorcoceras hygrometricum]
MYQRAQFSEKEDQLRSVDRLREVQLKEEWTGTSSRSAQRQAGAAQTRSQQQSLELNKEG